MEIKKCAVIGLGHFGYHLSLELSKLGVEVIAIDKCEIKVSEVKIVSPLLLKWILH